MPPIIEHVPPFVEALQMVLSAIGAGLSLNGWAQATQDYRDNLAAGLEGSLGISARWRVGRERSRFIKQALILFSSAVVLAFRWTHPDWPIAPLPVYGTRNAVLLALTGLLMWDTFTDRATRQEVAAAVREEHRRVRIGGRRKGDISPSEASTARIQGIVTIAPEEPSE